MRAKLWAPDQHQIARTNLTKFADYVANKRNPSFADYGALHRWSIGNPEQFWADLWDFCAVIGDRGSRILENGDKMPGTSFFPSAKLNFAENLLRKTGREDAIVFWGEDKVKLRLSWDDLHAQVSRLQQAFVDHGIKKGDRIAAMIANTPHAIIGLLAASSIGAVWTSCSPDFGVQGALDRFGQIEPKLLLVSDGYFYNGKLINIGGKVSEIAEKLMPEAVVVTPYLGLKPDEFSHGGRAVGWEDFIAPYSAKAVTFEPLAFNHPLYILYSSGTTGVPKCIIHSQGGALIQHLKEHQLHCDISAGDRVFYFTTCGWMMWNWLISALASETTLILYDGSPFAGNGTILFDLAEQEKITLFGTSAKFIDAVRNAGLIPAQSHDLSTIKTLTSTGSPLADENFHFAHDCIAPDAHLASMSGGTDIVACFVLGIPTLPVYVGEIQGPALGMATDVWDSEGRPIVGEKGELVCTRPFPSMPIGFYNDPDGNKYHTAYFSRFENTWWHGDFAEWTNNGGMIIHGRSDATLNPGGVRIGTAEIYNQVEKLEEVEEALCIGQTWPPNGTDIRVVLFVKLKDGLELDDDLIATIKATIRSGASPRHVPEKVIAVADIPRTKSGKITEIAVRDVVHGRPVGNKEALANPQALELFEDIPALKI